MVRLDAMRNGAGPGPLRQNELGQEIRLRELEKALANFPARGRILDLGAGTGFQAASLDALGYSVTAVDIGGRESETPDPTGGTLFPLDLYDGHTLPYRSGSFDVVFSSYVLEHVRDPVDLLRECSRVLAPVGKVVMVLPTFSWRLWSIAAFYVERTRSIIRGRVAGNLGATREMHSQQDHSRAYVSVFRRLIRTLIPPPHGEVGSSLTELVTYTRWCWRRILREADLRIVEEKSLGVFSTGAFLSRMSIERRELAARLLGGAGRVYVAVRR